GGRCRRTMGRSAMHHERSTGMTRLDHPCRRCAVAVALAVVFSAGSIYCYHQYATRWGVRARPDTCGPLPPRYCHTFAPPSEGGPPPHGYSFHLDIDERTTALRPMSDTDAEGRTYQGR